MEHWSKKKMKVIMVLVDQSKKYIDITYWRVMHALLSRSAVCVRV